VRFLVLGLLAIVVAGVTLFVQMRQRSKPQIDPNSAESFREHCQHLLETNKLDELIAYVRVRIRQRPNHTYAHWYLGRALYLQRNWTEALRAFNEVARLDPTWIEDSVTPYMRAIEAKLRAREMPFTPEMPEQPRTLH
jgi:cytochrome c-type biogenesis protein CcmH/NrfG